MNILDNLKKLFFFRQHPETALRYLPIVELIKKNSWLKSSFIEVGSGSYGITPYLKKEVVGVDNNFSEPEYPLLIQVFGSADKLPFTSSKFDIVLLSDVLEHIPDKKREQVLSEAVRVAKRAVIVSGPFGELSYKQDLQLADYSKAHLGKLHPYFEEHLKFGLPDISRIIGFLTRNKKIRKAEKVGEYLNLNVRSWIMKIYLSKNKLQYFFYLKGLMLFVPIFRLMNFKPCYRSLILAKIKK